MTALHTDKASRLAELKALRDKGIITNDEFLAMQQNGVSETRSPLIDLEIGAGWILIALIVGAIALDHLQGPIFPDFVYCVVGAGVKLHQPAQTTANSWSANNGCGAYQPQCATSWIGTPASSTCIHTSMWNAIRNKI